MAINVYTGLMGSGKSYEVVSSVVTTAIAAGRRVVTNVDGIDNEKVRQYVAETKKLPLDDLGHIVHCKNSDVEDPNFFPFGKEDVATFCLPGDMICLDEAWRFFQSGSKIHNNHQIFFREHRHYVHPDTKVSCDLVLMVQDISDLNRFLKSVVEVSFRTTKLKAIGAPKSYRVESFEGYRQTKSSRITVFVKRYDPKIFPLYSSYSGGSGNELVVDKRSSIFSQKGVWLYLPIVGVILLAVAFFTIKSFFSGDKYKKEEATPTDQTSTDPSNPYVPKPVSPGNSEVPPSSSSYSISGRWTTKEGDYYIVKNLETGGLFSVPTNQAKRSGPIVYLTIDNQQISLYSKKQESFSGSFAAPPPPPPK